MTNGGVGKRVSLGINSGLWFPRLSFVYTLLHSDHGVFSSSLSRFPDGKVRKGKQLSREVEGTCKKG